MQGERNAADVDGAEAWMENVYPDLIRDYDSRDIFNADETGLYFKALPSGTLTVKGSIPSGGKVLKDRITMLLLCNQNGSEKFIFTIGKSKSPRCFHRVRQLPVKYFANSKAWMTSEIWSQIITQLDQDFYSRKRKIILFVDNATCHNLIETIRLRSIRIIFLPPNTTSLIQPLDQGIIKNFKAYYRRAIVRKQIEALEEGVSSNDFPKTITVLMVN